jgi:hypothetical protein
MHHHRSRSRIVAAALAATALGPVALAACGDGQRPGSGPASGIARVRAHYISGTDLTRELSNDFRHGLYRLAVMSQPGDDAPDLGQPLPTGTLDRVRCSPRAGREWRCTVRWRTVEHRARTMRYRIRLRPNACFEASAEPALHPRYDSTINSYSEHPLNLLLSPRRGC